MSESTAKDMIEMMQGVVTGGTGTAARLSGMRVAGKTGTTSNNHDRWFVGYTPYYVGAVWFGYDQPAALRGFSPNPAAVAWRKVMAPIHKDLPNKAFLQNDKDDKYSIMLCADSGMRATPACKNLTSKEYKASAIPDKRCTTHPYTFNKNELNSGEVIEKDEEIEGIVENPEGENPEGTASSDTQILPEGGQTPPPANTPALPPTDGSGVEGIGL